ncbi:Cof-type HAD-IIB family hydrolase [Ectobacillus antri]|jgi:Cof subfamily protein (haloacid dehalogenase superfamily)|uniref:Cof-type HAD-IIB family hydrolase n=1 Tax=Ectobacillus antri TaxID=2486280 RepID=A0ABT6H0Y8_9BACI|nr:Cof-type HAD-IIB family hydrolase [Ectobacillus antri]MDG4655773.1 Cof-type HAD-IIB family hydrolase [Ectobacillus antri]MDG5752448.1 Cof-type HAD-IIB family hydrolase [Ectobacillus antri]
MNNKIVFFDIDGTLLDHDKRIPASTKKAVKQLQENGVHVAIATGRAPFMFEDIRKELNIHNYVSFNGQYVVFEDEVIYKNPLPGDKLHEFTQFANEINMPLVYLNEKEMKANVPDHPFVSESMGSLFFDYPLYEPNFYQNQEIYQTLLFCEAGKEQQFIHDYPQFHFIRWHAYSMDIIPNGGSKAKGIERFIERLGFKHDQVYAFGDGLNDIEMISEVGTGIVMGNGHEKLKQVGKYVTKDVGQDGILHGLQWAGLL